MHLHGSTLDTTSQYCLLTDRGDGKESDSGKCVDRNLVPNEVKLASLLCRGRRRILDIHPQSANVNQAFTFVFVVFKLKD